MFYVFGINGPMYQGSSHERLSQISAVRAVARPAGLRANASGVESREAQARQPAAAPNQARHAVVAAYQGTQSGPKLERRPLELVADVMTRGVLSVSPRDSLQQAWSLLTQQGVGQSPVLDDSGRVVGLLLRADLMAHLARAQALEQMGSLGQHQVATIMLTPVPAVSEDTPLRRLAYVLMDTGLPGLPVTDDAGRVSGFVSRTDILRAVAADPPLDIWG